MCWKMNLNPTAAIVEMLHEIAAHPWVYDRIQSFAGQKENLDRIARHTDAMDAETVVDVGGGTGTSRTLWPTSCRYVCLDIEMPKLEGFRSKVPGGLAVLSDATQMPIATGAVDVVMCMAVAHHLTDVKLDQVLGETLRVLKVGGRLILLDPVLNRERLAGRILWRLDRGSYPRTAEELRKKLQDRFRVVHWEKFAIYHEYVFGIGVRS
jgi:ubiquinone/menaquinone biosynthesis C-methylase UbiE